jgi:DNA polymerase-1
MNILAETYLNYKTVPIESLIGKKGKDQTTMQEVEIEKIAEYAGEDADITLQLKEVFVPMLRENKMEKLFHEVENPLVRFGRDGTYRSKSRYSCFRRIV